MKKNDLNAAEKERKQRIDDLEFAINDQIWSDMLDPDSELGDIMRGATPIKKEVAVVTPQVELQITLKTAIAGAIFVMLISGITSLAVVSTFYVSVMK